MIREHTTFPPFPTTTMQNQACRDRLSSPGFPQSSQDPRLSMPQLPQHPCILPEVLRPMVGVHGIRLRVLQMFVVRLVAFILTTTMYHPQQTPRTTKNRMKALRLYAQVEVDGQWRSDDEAVGERLYQDYLIAKRRWRRFSNRPPRRYRKFPNRPRAYGKGSRNPYSSSFASFLPQTLSLEGKASPRVKAVFAGKASGKGRGNPRGRDGRPLKCSKCGSTEHLWRRCPQVVQNQGGRSSADAHFATSNPQPAPTLRTIQAHDAHETALDEGFDSGMASRLLPSVSFAAFTSARSEISAQTGFEAELEALSQVSSLTSRNKRKKDSTS